MSTQLAYDNPVAEAFGMSDAPMLITRTMKKSIMSVTDIRSDRQNFGITKHIPYEDAYIISLRLRACPDHDLFFEGRYTKPQNSRDGVTSIYDLRRDPVADIRSTFHSLHFHLPRKVLNDIAEEAGALPIDDLHYEPGVAMNDPVVYQLLSALHPVMAKPDQVCPIYIDHVVLALSVHIAQAYGGIRVASKLPRGGLAPCQERRAKELMAANLGGDVSLERLAGECGLSVRHFARAFRQSTGMPPHRWLQKQRVEHAKDLLRDRALSLSDIALACGFSDQSHFTRVFTAMLAVSPGAWRRAHI